MTLDRGASGQDLLQVRFSPGQAETLRDVAHHYESVIGSARHVLRLVLPRQARIKYRYIVAESNHLEDVAKELMAAAGTSAELVCDVGLGEAVAFWGRLLSSLNTKRSRRRLSAEQITAQEQTADMLAGAIRAEWDHDRGAVEEVIQSRRRRERPWMMAALGQSVSEPERSASSPRGG